MKGESSVFNPYSIPCELAFFNQNDTILTLDLLRRKSPVDLRVDRPPIEFHGSDSIGLLHNGDGGSEFEKVKLTIVNFKLNRGACLAMRLAVQPAAGCLRFWCGGIFSKIHYVDLLLDDVPRIERGEGFGFGWGLE